jgi:hypothetical protein
MRKYLALSVLVLLATVAAGTGANVASAHGCTPGYYKNHTAPNENLSVSVAFPGALLPGYTTLTLKQALSLQGGPGIDGALQILLRTAAASYLNSTAPFVFSGPSTTQIQYSVAWLTNNGDRADILFYAAYLDNLNNSPQGCPNPYQK